MRTDGFWQLFYSKPGVVYFGSKTDIEALTGIGEGAFAIGYTTDMATDAEFGYFDGVDWHWGGTGGGAGVWGSITGTLSDQTDLQTALDSKEDESNKATDLTSNDNTHYPTTAAVQTAITNAVIGLLDYRGTYDASTNLFPASGGSGLIGAILKGDFWICSVAGTLGGIAVTPGDLIIALVDTPAQTASNWDLVSNELGYVAENQANKTDTMAGNEASSIKYLSSKGVYDYLISLVWLTAGIFGDWVAGLSAKTTPVDADTILLGDSAASDDVKKVTWANVKATLLTYFQTLFLAIDGWISYTTVIPTRIVSPLDGTFTVTIATPAVVTKTTHGLVTGEKIRLTTTGALPTGLAVATDYFVILVSANTFNLATTLSNAILGTKINTSGSQSGTHSLVVQEDPTYRLQFASVDLTGTLQEGMPIKWTQNSIVRYGFISSVPALSGSDTKITVLTRQDSSADYDVLDTGSFAISNFAYGLPKSTPKGFPSSNENWDNVFTSSANQLATGSSSGVAYAPGGMGLAVPVGQWEVIANFITWIEFSGTARYSVQGVFAGTSRVYYFLASSTDLIANGGYDLSELKHLTTLTLVYLVTMTSTASATAERIRGDISQTIIRAKCKYLD